MCVNYGLTYEFMSSYRRFERGERGIRVVKTRIIKSTRDLLIIDPQKVDSSKFTIIKPTHDLLIIDPEEVDSSKSTIKRIQLPMDFNLLVDKVDCRIKIIGGLEGLVSIDKFILNPSSKEVIKLPDPNDSVARPSLGRHDKYFKCLGRPDKYFYYLGFDSDSGIYKVLALPYLIFIEFANDRLHLYLIPKVVTLGTVNAA